MLRKCIFNIDVYLECQPVFHFLSQCLVHCSVKVNQDFKRQLRGDLTILFLKVEMKLREFEVCIKQQ